MRTSFIIRDGTQGICQAMVQYIWVLRVQPIHCKLFTYLVDVLKIGRPSQEALGHNSHELVKQDQKSTSQLPVDIVPIACLNGDFKQAAVEARNYKADNWRNGHRHCKFVYVSLEKSNAAGMHKVPAYSVLFTNKIKYDRCQTHCKCKDSNPNINSALLYPKIHIDISQQNRIGNHLDQK